MRIPGERSTRLAALVGLLTVLALTGLGALGQGTATAAALPAPWSVEAFPAPAAATDPLPGSVSCVQATCVGVGTYYDRAGTDTPLADVYTGTAWQLTKTPATPSGFGGGYAGVSCPTTTSCLAVGFDFGDFSGFTEFPIAARWNGSSWTTVTVPRPAGGPNQSSTFSSVSCPATTACVAVGSSVNPVSTQLPQHPLASTWNGSAWTYRAVPVPAGVIYSSLAAVSCTALNQCTAVGSYTTPGGQTVLPLVERWNGVAWALQQAPAVSGVYSTSLSGVDCISATRCTAVGRSYATATGPATAIVDSWDGSAWTAQPVRGLPSDTGLAGVSCRSVTDCEAVGASKITTTSNTALAVRLTGSVWQTEPTAIPAAARTLADVSCTSSGCQSVGWTLIDPVNVVYAPLAERHR